MIQSVCTRVGHWVNTYWTSASPLSHTRVFATPPATNGAQKDVFKTLSSTLRSRNSEHHLEDIATKRPRRVYYILYACARVFIGSWRIPHYNTHGRGLTELLILIGRQCEGPVSEVSGGKFSPTSFSFPYISIY